MSEGKAPPSIEEVSKGLNRALSRFTDGERDLIALDPSERSLTRRLALYIEREFEGWAVDCEYNRVGIDNPKEILANAPGSVAPDADDAVTVFPDIIVHRRGPQGPNLLVVEAKKATSRVPRDFDLLKLYAYRTQLGYPYAAFVVLPAGDKSGEQPEWAYG